MYKENSLKLLFPQWKRNNLLFFSFCLIKVAWFLQISSFYAYLYLILKTLAQFNLGAHPHTNLFGFMWVVSTFHSNEITDEERKWMTMLKPKLWHKKRFVEGFEWKSTMCMSLIEWETEEEKWDFKCSRKPFFFAFPPFFFFLGLVFHSIENKFIARNATK